MSLFKATTVEGQNISVNPLHVSAIVEGIIDSSGAQQSEGGCTIILTNGTAFQVTTTYRSVRGYVNKADTTVDEA